MLVAIFDDAADLDVGHGESLGEQLDGPCLYDGLVINGAVEVDDAAVRVDGPRVNGANVLGPLVEGDLDVGKLAPFFRQDFDSRLVTLPRSVVVAVDLPVQQDIRSPGGMRLAGPPEFFRRDRQPVFGSA